MQWNVHFARYPERNAYRQIACSPYLPDAVRYRVRARLADVPQGFDTCEFQQRRNAVEHPDDRNATASLDDLHGWLPVRRRDSVRWGPLYRKLERQLLRRGRPDREDYLDDVCRQSSRSSRPRLYAGHRRGRA